MQLTKRLRYAWLARAGLGVAALCAVLGAAVRAAESPVTVPTVKAVPKSTPSATAETERQQAEARRREKEDALIKADAASSKPNATAGQQPQSLLERITRQLGDLKPQPHKEEIAEEHPW